jgi:hypothetical protein
MLKTLVAAIFAAVTSLMQHPSMPAGMSHEEHLRQMRKDAELKKRGAIAMGFDQDRTTHHFRTAADGGTIEVEVNDPADAASRAQIRAHLKEIAAAFSRGDFDKPFQTHAEVPPGVPAMTRLKDAIAFTYRDTPNGGRVQIRTTNVEAIEAVHAFLEYQIREHHTRVSS